MPLTNYSTSQQQVLDSLERNSNFRSRSFTFVNETTSERIEDAIIMDSSGELIFKDKNTEVVLSELMSKKKYIVEEVNEFNEETLYFQDEFNERISLGDMYANVQRLVNSNLVFWHAGRAEKYLSSDSGLDGYLKEKVFYTAKTEQISAEKTTATILFHQLLDSNEEKWNNRWIDIPCMAVETPDYVNGKYANISAKIHVKTRSAKMSYVGFRIIDATTGIELTRTVHASSSQSGEESTYTVPLSYQGPLPDTEIPTETNSSVLTYSDIQNLGGSEGNFDFLTTPLSEVETEGLPPTRHLIKIQWIVCELSVGVLGDGEILDGTLREFDPSGMSSLDVTIYSSNTTETEVSELNGQLFFDEVDGNLIHYTYEKKPYGIRDDYNVLLSSNKNVNLSVVSKSTTGFVIKTNRKPKDLVVDWCITYELEPQLSSDVLNDPERALNHFLFKSKEDSIDFCFEISSSGGPGGGGGGGGGSPPPEGCECCECCTHDDVRVTYTLTNGLSSISCDDIDFDDEVDCVNDLPIIRKTKDYVMAFDSFGNRAYSYDLSHVFEYLAQIVVTPAGYGRGGSSTDSFGNPIFFTGSEHCSYSFDQTSGNTSKMVSQGESVTVYKILNSEITYYCYNPPQLPDIVPDPILPPPPPPAPAPPPITGINTDFIFSGRFNKLSSIFNQDLYLDGLDNETEVELVDNFNSINVSKEKGLERLAFDKRTNPLELPVQLVSDNLIKLDLSKEYYDAYFENPSSAYLKSSKETNPISFLNINEGFLSIKAFRNNLVVFDPRPEIKFTPGENIFFPTFDPIYNKKSLNEILEYIYTAVYPVDNVPVFPNFRIGNYIVNGAKYNPLYDFRNFRTHGYYQTFTKEGQNESIFISDPMNLYIQDFSIGKIINYNNQYYQVKRDYNYTSPIFTSINSNGEAKKVKPSGIMFKKVSQELFDLNPPLQLVL